MNSFATIIVGGGPGGLGPLIAAAQAGALEDWLDRGVALVERGDRLGGSLGRFGIASDSLGGSYLECLEAPQLPAPLRRLQGHPVAREIERHRHGFPPLELVDRWMALLGRALAGMIEDHPASRLYRRTTATSARLQADGSVALEIERGGETRTLAAPAAVLALGGRQSWRERPLAPGLRLADCRLRHVLPSDRLLERDGLAEADAILARAGGRKVLILGGSHSAYAAAWALLQLPGAARLAPGQIEIVQRRPPVVFYPDARAAAADLYPVRPGDICPRTGRVHRMGGLRGFGRDMWRQIAGRPGTTAEPRVGTRALASLPPGLLQAMLEEAALVVACFGYGSITLPVHDAAGARLALAADDGLPAVGEACRLALSDGGTIDRLFGIGLGTGYRLPAAMGGEPNFDGQANSLWLYQNDIGATVHREALKLAGARPYARRAGGPDQRGKSFVSSPNRSSARATEWLTISSTLRGRA